jgi:tetratricopeptide (TPR) repeat protein
MSQLPRRPCALVCSVLVAVVLAAGGPGRAGADDGVALARERFAAGQQHFELGEFREALAEFKEAYRLRQDPALLFNIGQCQFKLHEDEAALHSYRTYLRRMKDPPNRAFVEARIAEVERRMSAGAPPPRLPAAGATPEPAPVVRIERAAQPERAAVAPSPRSRWWLWAGAAVLVGGATAILLVRRDPTRVPDSELGARRAFP